MDIAVDPNLPLFNFCEFLQQIFGKEDFRLEMLVRLDPLAIEVNPSDRVTVVTTDDSIRVQDRYQYEGIVKSQ